MDQLTRLQCQNMALETELRLVKQQLADAQTGTAHLVSIIGKQHAQTERDNAEHLRLQLQSVQTENVRLRGLVRQRLDMQTQSGPALEDPFMDPGMFLQHQPAARVVPPESDPMDKWRDTARLDLLSFDDDGQGRVAKGWSESPRDGGWVVNDNNAAIPGASRRVSGRVGKDVATSSWRFPISPNSVEDLPANVSFSTVADTEASKGGLQTDLVNFDEPDVPTGPKRTYAPHHFTQWERGHLLGIACFIEDMDDEEYALKWVDVAKRRGRHSPEDWQEYYEKEIRPVYQTNQAAAVAGRSFSEESGVASGDGEPESDAVKTVMRDQAAGDRLLEAAAKAAAEILVPITETAGSKEQEASSPKSATSQVLKHDSPREKTMPAPAVPALPQEGLMASRWAPQEKVEASVLTQQIVRVVEAVDPTDQGSKHPELLSVDDFCEELNKTPETEPKSHSFAPELPVPGITEVGEGRTSGKDLQREAIESTASSFSETGRPGTSGRPAQRPDNRPRRNFADRDIKPRCCHWPWDEQQLFHSNFSHDPSTMRTAMISNIPACRSLADVLDTVRGGKIISADFLPLSKMRTTPAIETNSVMVTFLRADKAHAYADFCSKNEVLLQAKDDSVPSKIQVTHIKKPIRPFTPTTTSPQDRPSRVLFVHDDGSKTAEQVMMTVSTSLNQRTIPSYFKHPLRMGKDDDGVMYFEFASIEDAIIIKQAMESLHWDLGGASKGFLPDPCERSLQSLVEGASNNESATEEADNLVMPDAEHVLANTESQEAPACLLTDPERTVAAKWSNFGDLEAARSFKGSVKQNYV